MAARVLSISLAGGFHHSPFHKYETIQTFLIVIYCLYIAIQAQPRRLHRCRVGSELVFGEDRK